MSMCFTEGWIDLVTLCFYFICRIFLNLIDPGILCQSCFSLVEVENPFKAVTVVIKFYLSNSSMVKIDLGIFFVTHFTNNLK